MTKEVTKQVALADMMVQSSCPMRYITARIVARTFIVLSAFSLGACTATSTANLASADSENYNKEPWFCQVAETKGQWECIQSETLAASPKPQRLPEPLGKPQAELPPVVEEFAEALPRPTPASKPIPVPVQISQPPEPAQPPELAQNGLPKQSTQIQAADIPAYVALSYRPDEPVSILDLPQNYYAVQLVALSSKEALEEYAKKNKIRGMSAARVATGEKIFYILLLGIYENRSNAEQAIDSLTAPFNTLGSWIRSVGSLQKAMLAADAITADTSLTDTST
ncbi:MAG: hypothetical protein GXP16_13470 [Gammaproteobacteria bacterium]|nr:hypothetical protein [Gammaproteobacteria bacterium]